MIGEADLSPQFPLCRAGVDRRGKLCDESPGSVEQSDRPVFAVALRMLIHDGLGINRAAALASFIHAP